jgi:TonB-dependent receptor
MKHILTSILLNLFAISLYAQGTLTGTVSDKKTAETIPGATVTIVGTSLAMSCDIEGKFKFTKMASGTYTIEIKMMGYAPKILKDVVIDNAKTTNIDLLLEEPSTVKINEIEIVASAKRESMNAILIQQKNRASVSDGISAEAIKKTPDKNASDVVKRISGTTIQDNKFVIVRGLNDRYNFNMLNSNPLPSTESDRKAFSFDLFPAALLDNITIVKTGTPDMPGDFAGGIVSINTKAIPESNTQSLSFSLGSNSISTNKSFIKQDIKGKYDYLGIDDGSRELSTNLPDTNFKNATATERVAYAKLIKNDWNLNTIQKAAPNMSLQYQLGRVGKVFKNETGFIFALTYSNNYNTQYAKRCEFTEQGDVAPIKEFELNDTTYSNQINSGIVFNAATKIRKHSQISFKNLYTINTDNRVVSRNGIRDYSNDIQQLEQSNVRWYTENRLASSQLQGEHLISAKRGIKINWSTAYNQMIRNTPAIKRMMYTKSHMKNTEDTTFNSAPFAASILSAGATPNSGGNVFSSKNNEQMKSGNVDFTLPLNFLKKVKSEVKLGIAIFEREREFNARHLSYNTYKVYNRKSPVKFADSLLMLPVNQMFDTANMGIISPFEAATATTPKKTGLSGFTLDEATKLNDSYTASSLLKAAYALYDIRFLNNWRIISGARMEQYNQKVNSFADDGTPIIVDNTVTDFLPSANLVYSLTEKSNLRAAYYKTVSRPEYRELAPFGFFDFSTFFTVRGNPNLQRAIIQNYDIRYEWFGTFNQLLSASAFYKNFTGAIEQVSVPSESRTIDYQNINKATNYGIELEARVNAAAITKKYENKYLASLSAFCNVSLIKSRVDLSDVKDAGAASRPLQGQSPYIINTGLQYYDSEKSQGISISLNKIGRRIYLVGNLAEPSIWENPRTVIDAQISKTFFKRLEVKFNVKDVLANNFLFYQDINNDGKYNKDLDNLMTNIYSGRSFSLSINYKFK